MRPLDDIVETMPPGLVSNLLAGSGADALT